MNAKALDVGQVLEVLPAISVRTSKGTGGRGRLKSSLQAKCARRRHESATFFKNEHAAQARAQWQVRGGCAGLQRCTENACFSQVNVKIRTARRRELNF